MLSELLESNRAVLQKTNSFMLPQLNRIIELTARIQTEAGNDYLNMFERVELPKRSYLLRAGTVCRHYWFLGKGVARVFACKNGTEVNLYFFFPSEVIDSYGNSSLQLPSETSIQLLEDAVVYSVPKRSIDELKAAYPFIADIEKILSDCYTRWMAECLCRSRCMNALQHYRYMLEKQPYLFQYVSLYHLSLYLGITPQSLSRIRNARHLSLKEECM
jgi:CRP-like cAMP-binding protein